MSSLPGQVGARPSGAGAPHGNANAEQAEAARKQAEAREEQRRLILKQVLTPSAAERLSNVSLVKPEKARSVETYLINAAQTGKLSGQVTEEHLKDILVQATAQTQSKTKVTIQRRRDAFDDDDDDDDDFDDF